MPKPNHVVPSKAKGGWAVIKAGDTRVSKSFKTKEEAVRYGREISRSEQSALYIHKEDGTIQYRNAYGNDPHAPIG